MTVQGFVLGKFMPPHAGHLHLCEVAQQMSDELTIVVGSLAREPIPGELRVAWMRELMPRARVVHLTAELPQEPSEHPRFWDLWREHLRAILPAPPDRVFSSDRYGLRLAAELGATWIPVDPGRSVFPVSGTAIRGASMQHFAHLPRRAFEALAPGGRFAIDTPNVPGLYAAFRPSDITRRATPGGDLVMLRESRLDLARGLLHKRWTFVLPDGRRLERPSTIKLYSPDRLAALLASVGFEDLRVFGGVDGQPITLDSPRCIIIGRRPSPSGARA